MSLTHYEQIALVLGHLMTVLGVGMALVLFRRVRLEGRTPGGTLAWVLGMIFIPYIAIPLYLMMGGRKFRRMADRKDSLVLSNENSDLDTEHLSELAKSMVQGTQSSPPVSLGNRVGMLADGLDDYRKLMELIEGAKESIHITTFILSKDDVGRRIIEALARKAAQGVKVRLLLDALGSFRSGGSFVDPLREAGGKVGKFMPMLPFHRRWSANLRNHRKMYIFDERLAIIGGRNLGEEYMGPKEDARRWSDFAVTVEGPAVFTLNEVFAADWSFATDEPRDEILSRKSASEFSAGGDVTVQTVASGPDVPSDMFYEVLVSAIFQAKKRVWVVTPYFVPDETLLRILMILAHLGRDVRLIVPYTSNQVLVDLARRYALRELANAGGKVLMYGPKMLHTKLLLIDDEIASVGSANMDMRSLYLNYEIALFMYDAKVAREIELHILDLIENSRLFTRGERRRVRGIITESLENLGHILSPLL